MHGKGITRCAMQGLGCTLPSAHQLTCKVALGERQRSVWLQPRTRTTPSVVFSCASPLELSCQSQVQTLRAMSCCSACEALDSKGVSARPTLCKRTTIHVA